MSFSSKVFNTALSPAGGKETNMEFPYRPKKLQSSFREGWLSTRAESSSKQQRSQWRATGAGSPMPLAFFYLLVLSFQHCASLWCWATPTINKPGHIYRYLLQKCCEWKLQFSLFGFLTLMLEVHPGCFSRAPEQEKGVTPPLASKQTSALRRSPWSTFHSWIPYYASAALRRDGGNKESICWSSSCTLVCSVLWNVNGLIWRAIL